MADPFMLPPGTLKRLVPLLIEQGDVLFCNTSVAYRAVQQGLEEQGVTVSEDDIARLVKTIKQEFSAKTKLPEHIETCGADENLLDHLFTAVANGDQGAVPYVEEELKIMVPMIAASIIREQEPDYAEMISQLKIKGFERTSLQLKSWRYSLASDILAVKRLKVQYVYDQKLLIVPRKIQKLMKLKVDGLNGAIWTINEHLWKKYGNDGTTLQELYQLALNDMEIKQEPESD